MRHISLGTLNISDIGKRYVNECLNANRLSRGRFTEKFEREFANLHGCKHGIFMNSGTSALQVALHALAETHGYQDGDEVLVPATTFIASSNVILQNSLTPVFVDVDPYTFNMDVTKLLKHITKRTRAIMPVHLFGFPAEMDTIMKIARNSKLQVIEDSCETMFAGVDGKPVGSFGDLACFSTYVAHLIVGGVGGLVTTNDDKLAKLCRSLMAHGRDSIYTSIDDDDDAGNGLKNIIERRYKFDRVGYSYRCTEIEAAIALSELERWEANIMKRRENATRLISLLEDLREYLQLPGWLAGIDHSWMMFPMVCKQGVSREALLLFLEQNGIETRFMFPLLSQPVYAKLFPGMDDKYPVAQRLAREGFFIGIHQGLNKSDIEYISQTIHRYLKP